MQIIRVLAVATGSLTLLGASCTTTAPTFVSGNVLPTSDQPLQYTVQTSDMDQPARMMQFPVPVRAPAGKVRIDAFIPDHWLDSPNFPLPVEIADPFIAWNLGISGIGDNRGYDPNTDAFKSRVAIELDFIAGSGRVVFNQSCIDAHVSWLGPGSSPSQTICEPAHRISSSIGEAGTNGFRTSYTESSGGGFDFYIDMSGLNAFSDVAPSPFNCAIDVGFHIYAVEGAIRVDLWQPFNYAVDDFPQIQAYWYDGGGSPARAVLLRDASPRGVSALCDHEYHS